MSPLADFEGAEKYVLLHFPARLDHHKKKKCSQSRPSRPWSGTEPKDLYFWSSRAVPCPLNANFATSPVFGGQTAFQWSPNGTPNLEICKCRQTPASPRKKNVCTKIYIYIYFTGFLKEFYCSQLDFVSVLQILYLLMVIAKPCELKSSVSISLIKFWV